MMTFREFVEYLEELSQQVKDSAAEKLLKKADEKRNLSAKLKTTDAIWKTTSRKVVDKLDQESRKHSTAAAKIITGK
jgi:hypothetical protein